jgi:hypothetical protein
MNPFLSVRDDMGLTHETQGSQHEYGWLHLLLTALGDAHEAYPTASTFSNPCREVLHRLKPYLTSFAGQRLEQMLAIRIPRFAN